MSGLCSSSAWFGACLTAAIVSLPLGILGPDVGWLLVGVVNGLSAWRLKKSLDNK